MNTKQSENLFERSKQWVPGGVHSPIRAFRGVGGIPRFIRSASGAEIEDVDGNRYIDYCMSWGPLIFGHQDPEVKASVLSALGRGWSYGATEPYSLELAELITENLPWVQKIRFVNSGTEAVISALRVARAATGRNKILKFDGCYHGHGDSMLVRAGSGLAEMASPDSAGVPQAVAADTIVIGLNDLNQLEQAFQIHGKEIAAVIVEPVPANNGLLLQTEEFLQKVSKLAKESGSLVIFDEVITGFRLAFGGMAERTGIRPDLVTFGKIIGGGFPVGAYGGRSDLMDWVAPLGPVYQAGTLSANPVAMAAGITTIKKLKRENPYPILEKKTQELARALINCAKDSSIPIHVQNISSLFWIAFGKVNTKDGYIRTPSQAPENSKKIYSSIFHSLLNQGIYLAPSAFEVSFLSTAHQDSHQERFIQAMKNALKEVEKVL